MSIIARVALYILATLFGVVLVIIALLFFPRPFFQWLGLRGRTAEEVRAEWMEGQV